MTVRDQRFVVWSVARNARAWLRRPHRLHDAGHCHPFPNSLVLGEPVLVQGLWAVPSRLFSASPIFAFNWALAATLLGAGLAMYWLVVQWTGVPAAGLVAALFYVFEPSRMADTVHLYIYDTTGAVLALGFAVRLFRHSRVRDAIGLALAGALQLGTSFYPLLATTAIAVPVAVWLAVRHRRLPPAHLLAIVVGGVAAAGLFVFLPYLELASAGGLPSRREHAWFAGLRTLLPGGRYNPSLPLALLAIAAFPWPRRRCLTLDADPRPALAVAWLLVAWLAAGPSARHWGLPDLYGAVAGLLPGLDQVRAPARISVGLAPLQCILAGIAVAAGLRLLPKGVRGTAGLAATAVTCTLLLWPALLGREPGPAFRALDLSPDLARLASYRGIPADAGALLELPLAGSRREGTTLSASLDRESRRILLSAYHGHRTSACAASYAPPEAAGEGIGEGDGEGDGEAAGLEALVARLDEPEAIEALAQMGFGAITLEPVAGSRFASPLARAATRGAVRGLPRHGPLQVYLIGEGATGDH